MDHQFAKHECETRFAELYGRLAAVTASAPGRLEVLGNHTDYNLGLTLSCAIGQRCFASLSATETPEIRLASTAFGAKPERYCLTEPTAPKGHWANYVLGLVSELRSQGHEVPGFDLLIHSEVLGSSGLSSSSSMQIAVLSALTDSMGLSLDPIQLAKIAPQVESTVVGAQTGLLDPLSSLLGRADHLLSIDFQTLNIQQHTMPPGWCFVAVDSGIKHDLTQEYNDRRALCEQAAATMGGSSLRDVGCDQLRAYRSSVPDAAWRCARHIVNENERVLKAHAALQQGDTGELGQLMFASHASSRDDFLNSCAELDALVLYGKSDKRCAGARLSGGGFGGITIHLVRTQEADSYLSDLLGWYEANGRIKPWGAVCRISDGARLER